MESFTLMTVHDAPRAMNFSLGRSARCMSHGAAISGWSRHPQSVRSAGWFVVESGSGMIIVVSFALLCVLSAMLAWIDIQHGIIPDWLNLAIAGLGLSRVLIVDGPLAGLEAACEGAMIGAIFWLLRRLYFAFRKIQGLGLGDVKFLAAAGIWVGVAGIPMLLLVAALTALACAGLMQLAGRQLNARTSISFGPFLAIGLLFAATFPPN
jgi:leader peptidase (prepilin peptidase) / N-methyltransferase